MVVLIFIPVLLILYLFYSWNTTPSLKLPPGPWNFPIVGNLHWLTKFPWKHFTKYGQVYGPLAYLKFGKTRLFLMNDISTWKEAFARPEFSRHPGGVFESYLKNKSIIFGNGNPELKHYMTKSLTEFGKNSLESLTSEEISLLVQKLVDSNEKPMAASSLFQIPTVNPIWTLLFGKRIGDDDESVHRIAKNVFLWSANSSSMGRESFLLLVPYMSKIYPNLSRNSFIKTTLVEMKNIVQTRIQDTVKSRQRSEVRCITDAFFDKLEQIDPNSGSIFAEGDTLPYMYMGLFMAGVDSTSTSLQWLILFLAANQHIQKRFQKEIDEVVGTRKPSLVDQSRLPYALAVIQETFRLSAIDIPQFHQAKENTKLLGFDIPKGSLLLPNVYGISRSTDVWGDPEVFRPDRFIDANGKFQRSNKFITFGYGRRSCLGESIARNQIFQFSTSIFQKFDVTFHGKVPSLNGIFGFFHYPHPFDVVFKKRERNQR